MQGDQSALSALWQEHRRWIAAVILAYKPRSEDLEDLLQEVAMTLVTKINTLREESNVRAWLRAVAVNVARAARRSERSKPVVRLASDHQEAPVMASHVEAIESRLDDHSQRVLANLSSLPDAYREPLLLKAVQGMRSRQISEILGIPEATVDTRISRARRMLREQARLHQPSEQISGPVTLNGVT
jgi:RNA polymerase sigma-70 factor (ECF subfamily)